MSADFLRGQYQEDSRFSRMPALHNTQSHPGLTLLAAGHRGGKTSFLRLLLDTTTISPAAPADQLSSVAKFVQGCSSHTSHIRSTTVDVLPDPASPSPLTLSLVDTPSFDQLDEAASERVISETMRHIESRFVEGVEDPSKARHGDHYVHLCVYFLDPDQIAPPTSPAPLAPLIKRPRTSSFSTAELDPPILEPPVTNNLLLSRPHLQAADITAIRRLSARVNVLPVVARADTLCNDRLSAIKLAVRRDLADSGIGFGIFDQDGNAYHQEEPSAETSNGHHPTNGSSRLSRSDSPSSPSLLRLPYALISPDIYSHSDGVPKVQPSRHDLILQYTPSYPHMQAPSKLVRGKYIRSYRWGFLDVLDANHTDFVPLRTAIFHHMETLQHYTRDYLFAKFKEDCLMQHRPDSRHSISHLTQGMPHSATPSSSRPVLSIETTSPLNLPRPPPNLFRGREGATMQPPPMRPGVPEMTEQKGPGSRNLTHDPIVHDKQQQQRGRKIPVACNFCRSRKLRCDGGRPACSQCIKRSNPCDYQGRRRRNGRSPRRDNDSESEGSMDERSPSNSPSHYPPSIPSRAGPSSRMRQNDLPGILSLALPNPSPASPVSAPFAPMRVVEDPRPQEQLTAPPASRKRASTMPGKNTRLPTTSGPKVVACNFCRARKTKCDGMMPACSSCSRRSLQCNYVNQERTAAHGARKGMRRASGASAPGGLQMRDDPMSSASPASSRMIPTPSDSYPTDMIDTRPAKKMRMSPLGQHL